MWMHIHLAKRFQDNWWIKLCVVHNWYCADNILLTIIMRIFYKTFLTFYLICCYRLFDGADGTATWVFNTCYSYGIVLKIILINIYKIKKFVVGPQIRSISNHVIIMG